MCTITLRLSGLEGPVGGMLAVLGGLPGSDRAEEMGAADVPRRRDDSSSAGLPDDTHAGSRDVEIHAVNEARLDTARDRTGIAARDAGVVIEWLEPF